MSKQLGKELYKHQTHEFNKIHENQTRGNFLVDESISNLKFAKCDNLFFDLDSTECAYFELRQIFTD